MAPTRSGQGLLIIAMIVVVAVLVLAMLYRVFIMTPAYVYQRSIYFVFKYNPQIVVQGITMQMNTALTAFVKNYSQFLLNYGIALQMPALQGGNFVPISLASMLGEYYDTIINMVYTPTGLAIQTGNRYYTPNLDTGYYGALALLSYIYADNNASTLYVAVNNTYDMPILGISNLDLQSTFNLTAWITKPGTATCIGNIHTTNYTITTTCTFNFTANNYTCQNPAFTTTGQAMNLWAPYYNALAKGRISIGGSGLVDTNNNYADPVMLLYPVDEVSANSGFVISAVFNITNPNKFLVGINFLAQYPTVDGVNPSMYYNYGSGYWVSVYPSRNKYYYAYGGPSVTPSSGSMSSTPNQLNITVVVQYGEVSSPFQPAPATATIYINGKSRGSIPITMPGWNLVYSQLFGNSAYMMSSSGGVGSWVVVMLQNAALLNVTISLINSYTLPTNIYLATSLNKQPAVGVNLDLLNVTMMNGIAEVPVQYEVCNITDDAVIFNVTLPTPTGYPYIQYLLMINYSGAVTLINPYSPAVLNYLGIPNMLNITAMAAYQLDFYNASANMLYQVPYIANNGIPTLMLFYDGHDESVYNGYVDLTPVSAMGELSISPPRETTFKIYTLKELFISLFPGYTPLNYTVSQSMISQAGLPTYSQLSVAEYYYSPSETHETLPITNAPTTIVNCLSNGYANYGLYFVNYGNYWGYCSYGSLQWNGMLCQPQQSSVGEC